MSTTSRLDDSTPPRQNASDLAGTSAVADRDGTGRRGRWFWRSGWPAGIAVVLLVAGVLHRFGVPVAQLVVFAVYLVVCLAVPGVLLLRALYGGVRTVVEEAAFGLALGYVIEVFAYIGARAAGRPLLVLLWPAATYAAFLAVPRLRAHWRRSAGRPPVPAWWPWFLALMVTYVVAWGSATFFRANALAWPATGTAHLDMPFNLALIAELRHHVPPSTPWVAGEGLFYHWFVFAHFAASSWITGIEPLVLLFRLTVLPMLAAFIVLVGMLASRVTGSRPAGALAVAGTLLVAMPSLYLNANGLFSWTGVVHDPWMHPTQTFGGLLFVPVVVLLMDLLEDRAHGAGRWVLLVLFVVAVMGAKATYVPLLVAGLAVVATVEFVRRRCMPWRTLAVLGLGLSCMAFAQFVLFGGARQGVSVAPLSLFRLTWGELTGLGSQASPPPGSLLGITLVYLLCWVVTWCGVLGLIARPRLLTRVPVLLMLTMAAAGAGVLFLFGSVGPPNQGYFLQAAYPYLATLTAYGLLTIARAGRVRFAAMAEAAAAGVLVAYLIRAVCAVQVPLSPGRTDGVLFLPFAVLAVLVALVAALVLVTRGRARAWALLIAAVAGAGAPSAWQARLTLLARGSTNGVHTEYHPRPDQVPRGLLDAGRWLRAHSAPGDLVATNAHCRWGAESPCASHHFWVSALTERRVLVEAWGFTPTNMDRARPGEHPEYRPFWDQRLFRLNEKVFLAPTAAAVEELRDRYGVRWLFADERHPVSASLGRFAELRLRDGDYAVYRLRDAPAHRLSGTVTS
ncbi:hypothetical protein [Sphaerisporangium rubeum]|uniref:Uncharacterized protein n=1 Tax=Sphaerisporangium rubeum TaxID=321317 RepID=A0A7X0ID67_9ACTN|nr:hypothetical protein [Sphaerisporangium rubeum]MBB6472981.1 hypothetical protein [Sphaerisporangium rubeum]